jgi:Divergent InlB B-repeat domain
MNEKRRARPKRLLLLAALIGAFLTVLAGAPSASAGLFTSESTLNITLAGTGSGQVTYTNAAGTPNALTCAPTCSTEYSWFIFSPPDQPTMTAIAAAGSTFAGWTVTPGIAVAAGCGLAITCQVNMGANNPVAVTATFNTAPPATFPLTILKAGTGQGTVTSTSVPAQASQINCGTACGAVYPSGAAVTLNAAPAAGSTFGGYTGGGCSANPVCVVTMTAAQTVTATFTTQTFPLTVTVSGQGGVGSTPAGVECQPTCTAQFASGTAVTLAAQAAPGWAFQGFSGACTGTTCAVTMSQAQSVTATFVQAQVDASVVNTRIRYTGPARAVRQLQVTVASGEDLARIVLRIRRGGVTLQSRTVRNFNADTAVLRMNIRNGIPSGRAQLTVTFVNEAGTQKVQARGIRIPGL